MTPVAYVVAAALTLLGTAFAGFLAYRSNRNSAANEFTKNLMERLGTVESRVTELEAQLTLSQRATIAAVRFIDRLVDWGRHGGHPPMPVPSPDLHEFLDPTLWGEAEPSPPKGDA